ncbi:hypothetical protein [Chlorogloeopsis sp. ULAP02]|uniref:hypothetical protein n=1 Tax=Chlorogloeopsis sp. ULAP02 TaxID=3107926 RepID=UPI00398A61A4
MSNSGLGNGDWGLGKEDTGTRRILIHVLAPCLPTPVAPSRETRPRRWLLSPLLILAPSP